jgi:hypothetical protein
MLADRMCRIILLVLVGGGEGELEGRQPLLSVNDLPVKGPSHTSASVTMPTSRRGVESPSDA